MTNKPQLSKERGRELENIQQQRVDVREQPPQVGQECLPGDGAIGNHVGEDRELGVALNYAAGRARDQGAALGERDEAVVDVVHQIEVRVDLVEICGR